MPTGPQLRANNSCTVERDSSGFVVEELRELRGGRKRRKKKKRGDRLYSPLCGLMT